MNTVILSQYLTSFKEWFTLNPKQSQAEKHERENRAKQARNYTQSKLLRMSEEEFYDYIAPLWAMTMWGNKHYQVDNIIEANGMSLLREQFANLIYGVDSIAKRWDTFRSKIKGVGPAIMSELLCKTYPDQYLLWNRKTFKGFSILEISDLPRYEAGMNGKTYEYLSAKGKEILSFAQQNHFEEISDMLTLNTFIWQELQIITDKEDSSEQKDLTPHSSQEAKFIHNDIRDKIADIGRFLGFRAEVEKKVAIGAVVDAIWEVTIGNMGRVIYVFEVQTSGSTDSLLMNLMRAKNNKAVQGIIAVSDRKQIPQIMNEASTLPLNSEIKYWDYLEVLKVHESLQYVNERINNLGLVPLGF